MWTLISQVTVTRRCYLSQSSHTIHSREVNMHLTIFCGCLNLSPMVTLSESKLQDYHLNPSQYGPTYNSSIFFFLSSLQFKDFLNVPAIIHYYRSWNLCSFMLHLLLKLSMTPEFSAQASFYLSLRQTSYGKTLLLSNMSPFLLIDNSAFYPIQ